MKLLFRLVAFTVLVAVSGEPSLAQSGPKDSLERLAKNKSLSRPEQAEIEGEVVNRGNKLKVATTENQRDDARKALAAPMRIPDASPAFREFYAQTCGEQLSALMSDDSKLDTALDAVFVLAVLDHEAVANGLAAALASPHPAVRFKAARAVSVLHAQLKSPTRAATMIEALGKAGAAEQNPLVLAEIYRALDVRAAGSEAKVAGPCATALAAIFKARAQRLAGGSHDDDLDQPGIAAAARCYPAVPAEQQAELIAGIARLMEMAVFRYFDVETSASTQASLKKHVKVLEDALVEMMRASKVDPPKVSIADSLPKDGGAMEATQAAIAPFKALLAGPPWNLKLP